MRCTSIFHKALNTTWFDNNDTSLCYGTQALIGLEVDESGYKLPVK